MSTPAHQSLRERLGMRIGATWAQDVATGGELLLAPGAAAVHLITEDLARTRRDRLQAHLETLAGRRQRLGVFASLAPLAGRSATLLPPDVWRQLCEAVGLRVSCEVFDDRPSSEEAWAAAWRASDPYRLGEAARVAFVLEPADAPEPAEAAALVRALIGPQHVGVAAGARLGFLLSGYQDFHTLQPWIARLRPEDAVVLLRDGGLAQAPDTFAALRAAVTPFDVAPAQAAEDVRDVLAGAHLDVLVSASESTANLTHLGNAACLLVARGLGIATAHAQHGIWPRAEFPPPIGSAADLVLAWANEYREVIGPPTRVAVVGAPRFDRYADRVHRRVEGLYGAWTRAYGRHVVVATNLHWTQHASPVDVPGLLRHLAASLPETLFTWKPHPYETPVAADALPRNVVVLPEPVMLAAGIEPADVVEAADLVVTTPSTFALEAALAGRPYLVLATGNANRHDHVRERAVSALEDWLRDPAPDEAADAYARRYCEPQTFGRALERALTALRGLPGEATPLPAHAAQVVNGLLAAMGRLAEEQRRLREQAADVALETARYVDSLRWTLARKDEYIATLQARQGPGRRSE